MWKRRPKLRTSGQVDDQNVALGDQELEAVYLEFTHLVHKELNQVTRRSTTNYDQLLPTTTNYYYYYLLLLTDN